MKKLGIIAAALLAASSAANAQYTDNIWEYVWDFDNGTQGWTINGAGAWQDTGGVGGTGGLFLPDSAFATIVPGVPLGGNLGGHYRFVLEAEIWVSNAGNFIQDSGIQAVRGDNKGPVLAGSNAGNMGVTGNDKSWLNSNKRQSWLFEDATAQNQWHKLQIDYGYTTPGKWSAWVELRGSGWWGTGPVWRNVVNNENVNPDGLPAAFETLRIGAIGNPSYGGGWSQARFDNVKLVPEPGSMIALGSGLIGMAGMIIRRKK